jgi:hypothetical protein
VDGYLAPMQSRHSPLHRVRRAAVGTAIGVIVLATGACGDDGDGDLELPPGPTEATVPDTTPTDDPTGDPDTESGGTVPGAPPGPADDDVAPPDAGGGEPGETPE